MKETIYDVAYAVREALPQYKRDNIPVVARVRGDFDGNDRIYWFIVGQRNYSMISLEHLKPFGIVVSRNSPIATKILNEELGTIIYYQSRNRIKRLEDHNILAISKADLENKQISIAGDSQVYIYDNLDVFLQTLRQNQAKIETKEREIEEQKRRIEELKKQENTSHERSVLTKGLQKIEEERRILTLQQDEMSQLTKYIRQQGKLRFNPILDPIQNRIKTKNLFNGVTVVIDGGPGTGKTTTMIQRLKYLTDWDAISEDDEEGLNEFQLTAKQRNDLHEAIREQRDWVFFSPSKLLKEYLSDAMNKEGLTNTNSKVWHWDEFRNKVIRENYLLIDPSDDNSPFKTSRSEEVLFYNSPNILHSFIDYFIDSFRQIKSRFPKIASDAQHYLWVTIAKSIQSRFDNVDDFNIQKFIQLFIALEQLYGDQCRELLSDNNNRISRITDEIYWLVKTNKTAYDSLASLANVTVTDQTEDIDEDQDIEDDSEVNEIQYDSKILALIRNWFRRYCYSKKNPEIRLTQRQSQISDSLLPLLTADHRSQIDRVGELVMFEQFAKYTRGVKNIIFGGFTTKYKKFRRQALANKDANWNLVELDSLLKRREGKELHRQEQALLIGFINNLVKMTLRASNKEMKHQFVDAYLELSRPIIGVDEATDFNECDIYAMQSFLNIDYSSFTLCGDLMQRLTAQGITSWEKIRPFVSDMKLLEMKTSYRQSVSLLNVAQSLYRDTIGEEPEYRPYMKSKKVPAPLAFVSHNENDKVEWIEKRIKDAYVAYGKKLPSIAIFLNKKSEISEFVEKLRETDFIYEANINVKDGSEGDKGDSNQIRVYPIDIVKGMEFDVVFFHNIDNSIESADLLKRYIYVGVSRAAFFLGITLSEDNQEITKYFEKGITWEVKAAPKQQPEIPLESTPIEQPEEKTVTKQLEASKEDRKGLPWTTEEEQLIVNYYNQGHSVLEISKAVGRTEISINMRLAKLGIIDYTYNYNEKVTIQDDFTTGKYFEKLPGHKYSESKPFYAYDGMFHCCIVMTSEGFFLKLTDGGYYYLSELISDDLDGHIWIHNKKERETSYDVSYTEDDVTSKHFGHIDEKYGERLLQYRDFKNGKTFTVNLKTGKKVK